MFSARQIIGVDIGSSRLKAVLMEYGADDDDALMRDYAMISTADPARPLQDQLRELLTKLKTRCRDCAVATWPDGARLRLFAREAEPELVRHVANLQPAGALFREDLDDYVTECGPVANLRNSSENSMFVASGIRRAELAAIEKAFHKLRYRLRLIQLTPLAILNAFTASHAETARKEPYVLVDLGHSRVTVLAGCGGTVSFLRTFDIDWQGISTPLTETATDSRSEEESSAALEMVTQALGRELWPVLDSFQTKEALGSADSEGFRVREEGDASLPQVHVSGGLSNHAPVIRELAEMLGVPCNKWNPFRHIPAHRKALRNFTLFDELANLPGAAGAAFQWAG